MKDLANHFRRELLLKKDMLPYLFYHQCDALFAMAAMGQGTEEEIIRHNRAYSVPSDEFWILLEQCSTKIRNLTGSIEPDRNFETGECGLEIDVVGPCSSSYDHVDCIVTHLTDVLVNAGRLEDLRSWGVVKKEMDTISKHSRNLRTAIGSFISNYSGEDIDCIDFDYGTGLEQNEARPISGSDWSDYLPLLVGLEDRLKRAKRLHRSQKSPTRHKHFATQVSNWFREYAGSPHKVISTEVSRLILLDEDKNIRTFENCLM